MAATGYYDENGIWQDGEDPVDHYGATPTPGTYNPVVGGGLDPWGQGPDSANYGYPPPTPGGDPSPAPAPGPTPPPSGSTIGPWNQSFSSPDWMDLPSMPSIPNAPTPDLPTYQRPDVYQANPFVAPTVDQIFSDPGFKETVNQGQQGLGAWASARGTLNDSETGKAFADYNRNAANTQIQNVWNRDLGAWQANEGNRLTTYNTNVENQNVKPYQFSYQSAMDRFTPQLAQWSAGNDLARLGYQTQAADVQAHNLSNQSSAWNKYLNGFDLWKFNTTNALNP